MLRVCFVIFISTLLISPLAHSQPNKANLELAKQHFLLGRTYFEQGAYSKALEAFKEAYRLSKKSDLLYNVAKCYENLGNLKAAIAEYGNYLIASANPDPNVNARIENLKTRLKAQEVAKPAVETSPAIKPEQEDAPLNLPEEPSDSAVWMKWTGWCLAGLGVASIGASVLFGVLANHKANRVEEAYSVGGYNWQQIQEYETAGKRYETGQIVTLIVGIASAGGGLAMALLSPVNETVSLSPLFGPQVAGISTSFSF
ncbi:MAG: tetratricopeptide repeat protein [Pseudomonadota bacterium]